MVLAAALRVGLSRAIQGEGYDVTSTQALVDAVSASVEVGLTMVGGQLATRFVGSMGRTSLGRGMAQSVERVFGQAGQRILGAGLEGSIDGTVGGIGEGLVQGLGAEATWEGDIGDTLASMGQSVGTAALFSAAGGFLAGSAFRSLGETFGPSLRGEVPEGAGPTRSADGVSGGQGEDVLSRSSRAEVRDTVSLEDSSHRALSEGPSGIDRDPDFDRVLDESAARIDGADYGGMLDEIALGTRLAGPVPERVGGLPLSGTARVKYEQVLADDALPDGLRREYLRALDEAVSAAGPGADIRAIMTQVARQDRFLAKGPRLNPETFGLHEGMTRVVPLNRIWEDNLDAAYRAGFKDMDDWLARLEANPAIFDPARHLDPSSTIPGKYATAWWAPRATQSGNTMAELVEELALNPSSYRGGMVRVTSSPRAAASASFHKPTTLDGMGFDEFDVALGHSWGVTSEGSLEAVSGRIGLGELSQVEFLPSRPGGAGPSGAADDIVGDVSDEFAALGGGAARPRIEPTPRYATGDYVSYEGSPHWGVVSEQDGIVTIVREGRSPTSALDIKKVPAAELSPGVKPGASPDVDPGTLGPDRSGRSSNAAPRDRAYNNRSGTQQLHVDPESDPALRQAIDDAMARVDRGGTPDEQLAHLVDYVHNDVTYDMNAQQAMYNRANSLPVGQARLGEMLQSGAVVCREKAIFTHQLLAELGISSKVVTGNVNVNGGTYGHAWVELADGTVVDGTWGKIYPGGTGYPVDRVIKGQVFSAPRSPLDPAAVDSAVSRASQVLDNPRQLRALQQQASGPRALSPADELLTNGNTVTLPERRGGLLGMLGMKKKARITRVERDMVFVEVDGQELMYPRGDILEANGISARSSTRATSSLEDDSHRAFAEGAGLDGATRAKLSSALSDDTIRDMVDQLGAERVARLSEGLKPAAVQRVWEAYRGEYDYLIHLMDDVGLRPRHIDRLPRGMGLAEAKDLSARVRALRDSGQIEGRLDEIEQRILSTKDASQRGGHIGELEAMERWVGEGRSVRAIAEVEDGGANPDFLVDGEYIEIKTTSRPLSENWLSNKLSHANAKARDQAIRETQQDLSVILEVQLTGDAARASLADVEPVVLSQFIETTNRGVGGLRLFSEGEQLAEWLRDSGGRITRTFP